MNSHLKSQRIAAEITLASAMLLSAMGTAQAVPFQLGDVFAATGSGNIQHWRSGSLLATYSTGQGGYTTGMAFDSTGNLYVTNFSAGNVTRFDNTGSVLPPNPFVTNDSSSSNESIVFDAAGNFYIGQADGTADVMKYAADGTFLGRYDVATEGRGSDWIDLAADQKTLFYTSEGRYIKRYDVAADVQLADFANLGGGTAYALRLLGDGGLLVADSADIKRLDAAGNVIQTYDMAGQDNWFALNLDPDGKTFWSGDLGSGKFAQFDIASSALLGSYDTGCGSYCLAGLTVYGEITAGGGGGGPTAVHEPASLALMSIGLLGMGGIRRAGNKG
ncbi:hypothetical protein QVG61_04245 [Thiohalobacter sp. IOR34]|uniref:hypothetical protein n=1 Tax=Thiohalobacter sp. IOR34 TaxID=3057176 RepID=UPI0025B1B15C|nr:hypothetical protein [Thiohalobacter sp. IOR34]WJW76311.1 hypothetical protein QVG61_04245 [Thiohalobacter sp. IOR34]